MSKNPEGELLFKLFRVRKNTLIKLRDSQYKIPLGSFDMKFDDFKKLYEKNRHHVYLPDVSPVNLPEEHKKGGGIFIYFEPSNKFDKKIFVSSVDKLSKEYKNLDKLFFVLKTYGKSNPKKLSTFVKNELQKYPNVEILQNIYPFSIMDNMILPECYLLDNDEKEGVIEYYDTSLSKFPKIHKNDPVAVHFNAKIGDMIYIKRNGGREITYRVVIKPNSG